MMSDTRKGDRHAHEAITIRPAEADRVRLLAVAGCEHDRCGDDGRCNQAAVRQVLALALTAYLDAECGVTTEAPRTLVESPVDTPPGAGLPGAPETVPGKASKCKHEFVIKGWCKECREYVGK